jgi:hypothetical protein
MQRHELYQKPVTLHVTVINDSFSLGHMQKFHIKVQGVQLKSGPLTKP